MLAPQTKIGPYELTVRLPGEGTGEVYKAIDTRLNRHVAIKFLAGPDIALLEHEARIIASMNNPYICAIYDIGDNYLVMEYVEGEPIKGPLPLNQCLVLAGQIAAALEAAHAQGVVHRDLKPENILVSDGHVKLLDFGHAEQLASTTSSAEPEPLRGTAAGMAAYMSPEQVQGRSVDARSDVFSFGVVLYELLSGRRAFTGATTLDVLNAVVNDEPRPLEAPGELQGVVKRCLYKDPAKRFQSMAEVRDALAQVKIHKPKKQPSIAVLPFANLSGDPANDYLCDGLTEEIINQLAQIPGVRVTARTSAFVFQKRSEDIRKIADVLDVHTVLEGSVRESGPRLRITAQLINATDGLHLWSKAYDREKTEVFEIEDDIAGSIVKSLQLRFYHGSTVNIAAYEAYLKARYQVWKLTPESLALCREYYERAIALDPEFALAHTGYANYFLAQAILGMVPAEEAMPAVRVSARRALDIDPFLPDAHAMLGTVATLFDFDWAEAERRFELAGAREAASSLPHILHGFYYLLPRGRAQEAVKEMERGLREDPLNSTLRRRLGICLWQCGRTAEASRHFREALELEHSVMSMTLVAMDYWSRGMKDEAVAWAQQAHTQAPWDDVAIGLYAGILTAMGERAQGAKIFETFGDGNSYGAPLGMAVCHVLVGEIDKAMDCLDKLVEHRYIGGVFQLLYCPIGKDLLASERWPQLAKTLGLPVTVSSRDGR